MPRRQNEPSGLIAQASYLGLLRPIANDHLEIGNFFIEAFPVPHDAPGGCFGYSILCEVGGRTKKITVATDMAFPTQSAIDAFANSDIIVIESNHDLDMLENSGRPIWLKKRIRERGHLSNNQCAETIVSAIERSTHLPESITLAHLSQECNTNALALNSVANALAHLGNHNITVYETFASKPGNQIFI